MTISWLIKVKSVSQNVKNFSFQTLVVILGYNISYRLCGDVSGGVLVKLVDGYLVTAPASMSTIRQCNNVSPVYPIQATDEQPSHCKWHHELVCLADFVCRLYDTPAFSWLYPFTTYSRKLCFVF